MEDRAAEQHEVEHPEDEIEPGEAEQGEQRGTRMHQRAAAIGRAQQPVHQPGLPAEFGGHPPGGGGDVGEGEGEHEHPQQPPAGEQPAAHVLHQRHPHQRDEDGAQAGHDVEGVVQQFDVGRPLVLGEGQQAVDLAMERPGGQVAQRSGKGERIVDAARLHVRLADYGDPRRGAAVEAALHRRQGGFLVVSDLLGLPIAGREGHHHGGDQADRGSAV